MSTFIHLRNVTLFQRSTKHVFLVCLTLAAATARAEIELKNIVVEGKSPDDHWNSRGSKVTRLGPNHFRMDLGKQPGIAHQAVFPCFRIAAGAKGNTLQMDVHGQKGHNNSYREYFYSWSTDRVTWHPVEWNESSLVFPTFPEDQVWVGGQIPISYNQLVEMVEKWNRHPAVEVRTIGKSSEGRDLIRIVITDPKSPHPRKNRWVHYFANQHGGEHLSQWRIIGALNWALSDEAVEFRKRSICHFIVMMSPDSVHNGWMRANAEGQDMNRSYLKTGANAKRQTTEPYLYQKDFETLMASESPVTTMWSCHTWGGKIDLLYNEGPEIGAKVGPLTDFGKILDRLDPDDLVNPFKGKEGGAETKWSRGPHLQFGITAFLCEGGGAQRTKREALQSGEIIMKGLSEYYPATRTR